MQSFDDYKKLVDAQKQLAKLKIQRETDQVSLRTYFDQKKLLQGIIEANKDAVKPFLVIKQEYTLQEILKFTFDELEVADLNDAAVDGLSLFVKDPLESPKPDTIVTLEGYDYENGNEEGYTEFVLQHNLELLYDGELLVNVTGSYKDDYKMPFNATRLIEALQHYLKHDDFMKFD